MTTKCISRSVFIVLSFICLMAATDAPAQTTSFSYQGRLTSAGVPPTASYDFEFRLFDAGGAMVGAAQQVSNVSVVNGVFNVTLDFGAGAFLTGANRFLEIGVRPSGGGGFTVLAPRQQILAAPYAIRSLTAATADNSAQLGGVNSSAFVQQDAGGNVSIAGGLTVSGALSLETVNAATQYNLGGSRVLSSAGSGNLFAGVNAGQSNTTGTSNSFFGYSAGQLNTTGISNSFFGSLAGQKNATGGANSFFGNQSGFNNTTGSNNAFFGNIAGLSNTTGAANSFFGSNAGFSSGSGNFNSFFGYNAGRDNQASENSFFGALSGVANTTGFRNAFFGNAAGVNNTTGFRNAFFGNESGTANTDGKLNSFFGDGSGAANTGGQSNSFFGQCAGCFNTNGSFNSFFGTRAGINNTTGINNTLFGFQAGDVNVTGSNNTIVGFQADFGANNLSNATAIGAGAVVSSSNALVLGNNLVNVGIGTSAPQARFNVVGSSWFQGDSTPLPASAGKGIVVGFGGEQGYIQAFDYGAFAAKNLLLNNSGGNVGIGTTTPNSRLTVAGLIETTLGGVKFPDGTIQTTASFGGAVNAILNQTTPQAGANFNVAGNGTVGGTLTATTAQIAGNGFVLGNFGIGTAAPKAKLDVTGGNILLDTPGSGIILKSPDGNTCRLLSVSDAGAATLTTVVCP
ncbi:MAG TPA: hypothetical protein VGC97_18820 [Pyrinomonadaceae bacterium]|jgi:hypothetical protein